MRPESIQVEGFSAYRSMEEPVEFGGVDFFSITGPTGSGKSSLIDAMIFALYGRVPRLGGNAVAPAIAAGRDRARVRLDFEVDGLSYTAVRMAQRTAAGGASVKEARLEQGEKVLADGAAEVSAKVEELLRLSFDDFTRTVVLPQGEFARFLTAPPRERQELLRSLLGLDVYVTVRNLARTRAAVASDRVDGARRSLEMLDLADAESMETAVSRVEDLEALTASLPDMEKALAAMEASLEKSRSSADSLVAAMKRLDSIEVPDRLDELDALQTEARARLADLQEVREVRSRALDELESRADALPSAEQVSHWNRDRNRLAEIEDKLVANEETVSAARKSLDTAESRLEQSVAAAGRARAELESARSDHAAHLLAAGLEEGETCPVCARVVTEIPDRPRLPALDALESALANAESDADRLRDETEIARTDLASLQAARSGLIDQRQDVLEELSASPEQEQLVDLERQIEEVARSLVAERAALKELDGDLKTAQRDLEDLADASRQVAKKLTGAQLTVADLEPPVSESDDVTVQWKELIVWRDQTANRLRASLEDATSAVSEREREVAGARREMVDILQAKGVPVVEPYAVQVATALQTARGTVESHQKAIAEADRLAKQIDEAGSEAAVAGTLASHLKSNGFEQWLMAGALAELVSGANDLLDQLSDGGYSLQADDAGSFAIVDHRNADETRSVSTLSGGETFLVSLALALSLAETLAAKGGSALDAIILDEGFGTLDDESLDIVASVLEELSGKGLMVGVITHVKELAARAPVRYEVRREPRSATVRLVS